LVVAVLEGVEVGTVVAVAVADRVGQHGLGRREQHGHVASVLDRPLVDLTELREILSETVEDHHAALGVGDLAATEHNRHLDLVLVAQEALDVALLRVVVVLGDLGAELDLADDDLLLVLLGLLDLLGLLLLVLRVVQDAADGRLGLRGDLDEIKILALRVAQRLVGLHDADLIARLVDQPDLGNADAFVDPGGVPLGRAPVEPSRDRHYRWVDRGRSAAISE
jgi:hypothetical protein